MNHNYLTYSTKLVLVYSVPNSYQNDIKIINIVKWSRDTAVTILWQFVHSLKQKS